MDADGMVIPLKYDGEVPKMYLFKHGIDEEKCVSRIFVFSASSTKYF